MWKSPGSDGCAFERQHFGIVTEEIGAVRKNLCGNSVKVSNLPHPKTHQNLFQSITKLISSLSIEFFRRTKSRKNDIVCGANVSLGDQKGHKNRAQILLASSYPRTREPNIFKMLEFACRIIANPTGEFVATEFSVGINLMAVSQGS